MHQYKNIKHRHTQNWGGERECKEINKTNGVMEMRWYKVVADGGCVQRCQRGKRKGETEGEKRANKERRKEKEKKMSH